MKTNQIAVKIILDRWNASIKNMDTLLNELNDEQLEKEIAVKKNRGIYLLGHLIAVHDDMLVLLNMGDKLFPQLHDVFIKNADKTTSTMPSVKELRTSWTKQCEVLKHKMDALNNEDWFNKHTAVSDEDFIKEPHRNKLNIILTRTTHLAYHTGQMLLLK